MIKGFLIVLVVLGHAIQCLYGTGNPRIWLQPVFNIIYTFHMPLFIFVSGIFFKSSLNRSLGKLVNDKFKRLILPSLIFSVLNSLLFVLITGESHGLGFYYKKYKYWFLICLFILILIYYIFYKGNKLVKVLIVAAYVVTIVFYSFLPSVIFRDCQLVRQFFIFGFATYISIYLYDKLVVVKKKGVAFSLISLIPIVVVRYVWGYNMMDYPILIRIIDQFFCSVFVFSIIYPLFSKLKLKKFSQPLIYLGQNSLGIYLIHVSLLKVYPYLGLSFSYNVLTVTSMTLLVLAFCVVMVELGKYLLGEKSFILGV